MGESVRRASREFQIPRSAVHDVVHKRLKLKAYKLQLVQKLQENDLPRRYDFAIYIFSRIDEDNDYLSKVCFSDEATFHISGTVFRHNCRIWGSENPHVVREHERDTPKLNVWCGLTSAGVIGAFFFQGKTVTGAVYLDMLENCIMPQVSDGYTFQHLPIAGHQSPNSSISISQEGGSVAVAPFHGPLDHRI
jgi:hypothetical protein